MSFKKFQFKNYIVEALEELKFTTQQRYKKKLIPIVLAGRDLVGESKTGSGKTHTFLLPIFQQLDETSDSVQAVITAPSRELALQIYQAARQIAAHSDVEVRVVNYVGGTDKARQIENWLATNHISLSERQVASMTWSNLVIWLFTRPRPLSSMKPI